ncbi:MULTISPECIES: VOC family protein [Pantoea]|uniref:VOC family protein n=1 Tax=Pantoea TaxID=53335 RepID=UPI000CF4542B|nr:MULTISPECIES: VOC family protein [Pantoea]PQL30049.1 prolyl endopeptidase [Pantoea ananatis]QXG52962.1 VOC family protein [Pantoea jilinensis]MCD2355827.1 VOC family protein [Pantoea sp. MHSD4]MDF2040748.1 VOC family protein [Pantoea sp. Cr_R14]MDF2071155.1 VOC family protein [Pantoea sp. Cr_R13]
MTIPHLRIARPVTDLTQSCQIYCLGLGLQKIGEFTDHQGFSGVMLGADGLAWHLEFTLCHTHPVRPSPTDDDLLVLYIPQQPDWLARCNSMDEAGFQRMPSFNPYWDQRGVTFMDGDGYRVVIQQAAWSPAR